MLTSNSGGKERANSFSLGSQLASYIYIDIYIEQGRLVVVAGERFLERLFNRGEVSGF